MSDDEISKAGDIALKGIEKILIDAGLAGVGLGTILIVIIQVAGRLLARAIGRDRVPVQLRKVAEQFERGELS